MCRSFPAVRPLRTKRSTLLALRPSRIRTASFIRSRSASRNQTGLIVRALARISRASPRPRGRPTERPPRRTTTRSGRGTSVGTWRHMGRSRGLAWPSPRSFAGRRTRTRRQRCAVVGSLRNPQPLAAVCLKLRHIRERGCWRLAAPKVVRTEAEPAVQLAAMANEWLGHFTYPSRAFNSAIRAARSSGVCTSCVWIGPPSLPVCSMAWRSP